MTDLQIYLLLAPVLALVFAGMMYVLTGWDDAREARKRAAKDVAPHRP
jgi:hypothetical protein